MESRHDGLTAPFPFHKIPPEAGHPCFRNKRPAREPKTNFGYAARENHPPASTDFIHIFPFPELLGNLSHEQGILP